MKPADYLRLRRGIIDAGYADEIAWAEGLKPPTSADVFASEYVWVVLNSGMKNQVARSIADKVYPAIEAGRSASTVFGHKAKCRAIDKFWQNRLGKSYTEDGLDSTFDQVKRALVKAGAIRQGLTFHGLRKSLGKAAADAGFSEDDIAGALGQSNPASARPYTIEASRRKGADRVFKALSKRK